MIVVYHSIVKVDEVMFVGAQQIPFDSSDSIAVVFSKLAQEFSTESIVWCNSIFKRDLQLAIINSEFHHAKMMLSYNPNDIDFLGDDLGYVEQFLFLNINRNISYPTWKMSSAVGVLHASVLLELENKIVKDANFDYFLNSLAKLCMPLGLLCYSEPKLLNGLRVKVPSRRNFFTLFRFTKQHYKIVWVYFLFLNLILYERKFPIFPLLFSFFFKRRKATGINLESVQVASSKKVILKGTIDVLIPTIGRRAQLYDFLVDLKQQTVLPSTVIIVEQNPELDSISDLGYLKDESWPFEINHTFIHQNGVCNARNLALSKVTSEWIFFADDDIRIEPNFIEDTLEQIKSYGAQAVSLQSYQPNRNPTTSPVQQWHSFGGGSSFLASSSVGGCTFSMNYEFGFGEDNDFGAQLRNKGCDVLYLSNPSILHLKAPIGGFRSTFAFRWQNDLIQPKPAPTVMLNFIINNSKQQLACYKTTLFFKYYKFQKIKNPYRYYVNFKKQWNQSTYWANELKKIQ